jgi:uncharacterized protein (DUF2345 family)
MSRKPIVRLQESFKLFVDKFNILSNNVGDPSQLNTYQDSDLVTVLNEIEAAFDASAGEILYPNGQAGETQTRLKISTNQSGGTDIDIDAGQDFLVDAVRHINLTSVNFDGDHSGTYINKVASTSLDSVGGTITVTGNSTYTLTTGSNFIQNTTGNIDMSASGNFIFDALGDITLDADGNDIIFKNGQGGDTVTHNIADDGHYTVTTPSDYTVDVDGDITFDAEGNDIIFKNGDGNDQVTHNLGVNGTYTISTPANLKLDVVGDIVLDADGNDLVFRNGDGGDSCRINLNNDATFDIHVPSDFLVDAAGDITLDAGGDNITLKDGGTTRQQYTLGGTTTIATTGNRTETVTGNVSDSAVGTYHIGATGNMDIDTRGTFDIVSGGAYGVTTGASFTQTTTGTVDINASQDITLNTDGDIVLDAGDSDIIFRRNGPSNNYARWQMGTEGNPNNFKLNVGKGDFTVDVAGDITLDAGDSDILFNRNGVEFVKTRMGVAGAPSRTRIIYGQGGVEFEAAGDITLDAGGEDIRLKDDGVEFGKLRHIGSNQLGIYSNQTLALSFEDSDAVFNNDVNIENDLDVDRHLNVDGDTTLNGNVTLGNGTGDDITFTGQVASNIVPKSDNAYNLGSSGKEWKNGYFDGTVFADNLDGDSGTIANFNFKDNTISGTSGINLDATGDIILHAAGDDIKFEGRYNSIDSDRVTFDLGNNSNSVTQHVYNRNLVFEVDKNIYLDANEGRVYLRDSASNGRFQVHFTTATGTEIDVPNGSLTFDVDGDIVLDANGGDVLLKDGGTQFGRFQNTSGNLIVRSGDTTAMTFSGANVTTAGTITPGTTLNTTATELVGAINEVHDDVGTLTDLSDSDYLNHKQSIIAALNRVGARVINVYDASGNLLNT